MRLAISDRAWLLLVLCLMFSPLIPARETRAQPADISVQGYDLAANQDAPEVCFRLSQTIARRPGVPLENSVAVDPGIAIVATPHEDRLCLTGFAFGQSYTVTLKSGLGGVSGVLATDAPFRIQIPNRPPELSFAAPDADVFPRAKLAGLPIRSVNVPKIDVAIFRITDRDVLLSPARRPLSGSSLAGFEPAHGERVWRGVVTPRAAANQDAMTLVPIDGTVGAPKPGLYVAVAWPADIPVEKSDAPLPTQYFAISDLGLATWRSEAGLLVAVRSLATATAAPGVDVALVGRNNRELGRVKSDENGLCRFDPNLLRGVGGDRPLGVAAYGAGGDFNFLAFPDEAPRAGEASLPALIQPNRAVYQPGDAVDLTILLRNGVGAAITKTAVTVDIIRPDGGIYDSRQLADAGDGGYALDFTLPGAGADGLWRVAVRRDADGAELGEASLDVAAPALSGLTVSATADAAVLDPAQPGAVAVQTQYPDGRAAPNAPGELQITVDAARTPFPAFPGFAFGPVDETLAPVMQDAVRFSTDAAGKANLPLKLSPPRTAKPVEARLTVRALDPGGRPVEQQTVVPVATRSFYLGVRAAPGPVFGETEPARLEIIALSPDGARQEKAGIGWEILREDTTPSWHPNGTRLEYRPATKDSHVTGGVVAVTTDAPAIVTPTLPPGRYRIAVFDPAGEAMSSIRFQVGWAAPEPGAPPDGLELKPAKPAFNPGENAEIFVKPPYESDILLVSADDQIRGVAFQHVPAGGATMHLDIPGDAGQALTIIATAFAPPDASAPDLPRRAFQSISLPRDPASRLLAVKLDIPEKASPRSDLPVMISVDGAGDEPVFVRVVAQDQEAGDDADQPAPPRAQPIAVDDIYGRVITTTGLDGGDPHQSATPATPRPPPQRVRPSPILLYSEVVALDKSGKGAIPLALPDFTGNLRIRVIAWSAGRYGVGERDLSVHDPLTLDLPLPAFLRPDDHADLTLALDNADGPRGEYKIKVRAEGAVATPADASATFNLAEREQRVQSIGILSQGPGEGRIRVAVEGPDHIAFERVFTVNVQDTPALFRHASVAVKPGGALSLDAGLLAGLRPESVVVSLLASRARQFDLPGLARELAASPPDSAERIVGAALPCLSPASAGPGPGDAGAASACLSRALDSLFAVQRKDGGFGRLGADAGDPWLTAYVLDFIDRARSAGIAPPPARMESALDFLRRDIDGFDPAVSFEPAEQGAEPPPPTVDAVAYANLVLAANDRLTIFELRNFADRVQERTPGIVALGMIGAAFAVLGDKPAAAATFARALSLPAGPASAEGLDSDLRDHALLAAMMAESGGAATQAVLDAFGKAEAAASGQRQLNAEEAAWIYRAALPVPVPAEPFKLKAGDRAIAQSEPYATVTKAGEPAPAIRNIGDAPLFVTVTVSGLPAQSEAKEGSGFEIERTVFDLSGKPVDPGAVRQGDMLVVVLSGRAAGSAGSNPFVADPLAGGWALEATGIDQPADRYPWLKDLTGAAYAAIDGGRFVAIPNLSADKRDFKLAYVIRAAVGGQFNLPGPAIDDLMTPGPSARGAASRVKIDPAS